MSSDNGIYVLHTKDGYRVAHLQAIENLYWNKGKRDNIPQVNAMINMFGDCKVHNTWEEVCKEIKKIEKKCGYTEYGINVLRHTDILFPTKKVIEPILSLSELSDKLIKEIPNISDTKNLPNFYFVGKAGSGKSFCARFMIKKYGYQVAKFAFPVYNLAYDYFNMDKNLKDRKLLQIIGTDSGRNEINSDIWVNRFKEDITMVKSTCEKMGKPIPKFVMDDCRFPNEHKVLRELGFVGIYLDVSDEKRKERLIGRDGTCQENTLNHSSETQINEFKDELIRLDGNHSLEYTYRMLNTLLDLVYWNTYNAKK